MWNQIQGTMARRLLINYRVPADIAAAVLPRGVRPALFRGHAIAGLCLVRLERMRFAGIPAFLGRASENLAVRMAVEWGAGTATRHAVLIFHRETNSPLNTFLGPRMHFGTYHPAAFNARDDGRNTTIDITGSALPHWLRVHTTPADSLPRNSLFDNLQQAETFFRGGECGYSPSRNPAVWEGIRLHLARWDLQPLRLLEARSTLMDRIFHHRAVPDCACIMRNIEHTWTFEERIHLGEARWSSPVLTPPALAA